MDADRNLLFGVLALQADLIEIRQFAEACTAWSARKNISLCELLIERGWLTPQDGADVEKLLQRKLQKHGGSSQASLAEITDAKVRNTLAVINDGDVQRSLAGLPKEVFVAAEKPSERTSAGDTPLGHTLVATVVYEPENRDRYRLNQLHAKGGMGQIWLARDDEIGREVALKELRPERAQNTGVRNRFLAEARITGQLEHPGIVPVYALACDPSRKQPFYTMRFVKGRTLTAAIKEYHARCVTREAGPLELRGLLDAFVHVCHALGYAHARGVVHRDLKPNNVILGDFGEAVVVDWGLAKVVGQEEATLEVAPVDSGLDSNPELTMAGQVIGTPGYMAPEQAAARLDLIDARTDVYGLGAILYEILTAQAPFFGAESEQLLQKVQKEAPPRPSEIRGKIPPALEAICLKALNREPAHRYLTALDLASDVQHFLADEPVAAYPEPVRLRLRRWSRRHRALVTSAAAVLIVASLALAVSLWTVASYNRRLDAQNQALDEANTGLVAANARETVARDEADKRRDEADNARKAIELNLVDLHTAFGLMADEQERPAQAALWFAHAAQLARHDPVRERDNRTRADIWSKQAPVPIRMLPQPGGQVAQVQLHPARTHVLIRTRKGECVLWDLASERQLALPDDPEKVSQAAWNPAGNVLVLASATGPVKLFSFPEGKCEQVLPFRGTVVDLAFSRDGRFLALAGLQLKVWDCRQARFLITPFQHPAAVFAVAFNQAGDRLATACGDSRGRVLAVDAESGVSAPLFPAVTHVRGSPQWFAPVFIDADQGLLTLSALGELSWRDAQTGRQLQSLLCTLPGSARMDIANVVASPDTRAFAIHGFREIHLWGTRPRSLIRRLEGHGNTVLQAAFAPDGKTLLSVSGDRTARLWSLPDGRPLGAPIPHPDEVAFAAFLADGRHFLTGETQGPVRVWRQAEEDPLASRLPFDCEHTYGAVSPDARFAMASGSHRESRLFETRVYDLTTSRPAGPPLQVTGMLFDAVFSPNQQQVLTLSSSNQLTGNNSGALDPSMRLPGTIEIWSWQSGKAAGPKISTPSLPLQAAYHPDGKRAAVLCVGGEVLWIDPASGQVHDRSATKARAAALYMMSMFVRSRWLGFTPDGRHFITAGSLNGVQVWDSETGALQHDFHEQASCFDFAMSADSRYLAVASQDKSVKIWDLATGAREAALDHPDWVFTVQFSDDGRHLLSACRDGMARIWDWKTGTQSCPPLNHKDEVFAARFVPRTPWIATVDRATKARLWECQTGKPLSPQISMDFQPHQLLMPCDGRHLVVAGRASWLKIVDLDRLRGIDHGETSGDGLVGLAEMSASKTIHAGGLSNLTTAEWMQRWQAHRAQRPLAELADLSKEETIAWRLRQYEATLQRTSTPSKEVNLDRVLELTPEDGSVLAERGLAYYRAGSYAKAVADFSRAIEVGEKGHENWLHRAMSYAKLGKHREAIDDFSLVIQRRPKDWRGFTLRCASYRELEDWPKAAEDVWQAVELGANQGSTWTEHALLALAAGDAKRYQESCAMQVIRYGKTTDPFTSATIAKVCALGPAGLPDYTHILAQARLAAASPLLRPGHVNFVGVLLYRAGKHREALEELSTRLAPATDPGQLASGGTPHDWFVLAMIYHKLEKPALARRWLEKAVAWTESAKRDPTAAWIQGSPATWDQRLELQLLRREAESLLTALPMKKDSDPPAQK